MTTVYPFLKDLALNNNRPWFETNRSRYDQARKEFEVLLANCIAQVGRFEDLGDLKPKDTVFRIYRDVRFSKNKDPFKKNFSALISRHGKKAMTGFSWYLHVQPGESFMASGIYEPSPDQLARIRQEIDYNAEEFRKILQHPPFRERFGDMQGNQLKTAPKGYAKDHPDIDLLRYTQFYMMVSYSEAEVRHPDFPRKFSEDCQLVRPFLEFLNRALD